MKIHSKNIIESLETRIANHANPKQKDLLVSETGVMETWAPYVGQMCAEYVNGEWLWQPYGRLSDYMSSIDEAQAELEAWP